MLYRDYIWDLGGTLLDNYELSTEAFLESLSHYHIQAKHDDVYKALKKSTQFAIATYAANQPHFLSFYKEKEREKLANPVLFPGAKDALKTIVEAGGRNFLISHRNKHVLMILDQLQITKWFTEIVTSDDGFPRKPNPQSMLYIKEKYHLEHAVVIGDRDIDIVAGRAAGLETILFEGKQNLMDII